MTKPNVISLFTGAGGLDLGFHEAGLRTAVVVEMAHDCCETLRANKGRHYPWEVIETRSSPRRRVRSLRRAAPRDVSCASLLPPRLNPVPGAELLRPVPKKYLMLPGPHDAHPGKGIGYGALSRAADDGART